jgi:ABC-type molybdate transport system substrate-binding protein
MGPKKQHNEGVSMRDYTYVEGYRFNIWNIYRSKRFDVDRLDINFADKDRPDFIRGLRIVDHQESETYLAHGDDADNISYSMCFIHNSNKEERADQFDDYLLQAIAKKEYLVHKLFVEERTTDSAVH